jgi:hypothetical protein
VRRARALVLPTTTLCIDGDDAEQQRDQCDD